MQLKHLLTEGQIEQVQAFLPKLRLTKPLKSTAGVADDEISPEGAMSINYSSTAQVIYGGLQKACNSKTPREMFESIARDLSSSTPEKALDAMENLSNKETLHTLFAELSDLSNLTITLNSCCFTVNKSIKSLLTAAIKEKKLSRELDSEFAQAAASFQSEVVKELCASYADQIYFMDDLKNKVQGSKPESMEDSEWNKMKNKYESAVKSHAAMEKIVYQAFIDISEHIKF